MDKNTVRSIIFLIAGLALMIFPGKLLKMQNYLTKKLGIKYSDSKVTVIFLGICFLVVSMVLFLVCQF